MELYLNKSLTLSKHKFFSVFMGGAFLLALCCISPSAKACDRSFMTLDSVACEAGNFRIHLTLCIGGGVTGVNKGAGNATRTIAFGFYTSLASMSVLNFTPTNVTADSTGTTLFGLNFGPVATSPFGTQATVLYQDLATTPGFTCITTTSQCGNVHSQCNQYSFLTSVIPDSIRLFGAEGGGNPHSGCLSNPDMLIVFPQPGPQIVPTANAGLDTLICRGDTFSLGGNHNLPYGSSNYSFAWSPPTYLNDPTLANPLAWPQTTTTFALAISGQASCFSSDLDSVTVTVDTACVWPGDCNYDLTANYLDIFPIGLAYNNAGPIRPVTGNAWFGHPAYDWSGNFTNGPNHKHADSNGDGFVNIFDVSAILSNYGQVHSPNRLNASGNHFVHFYALPDSAMAGDSLWIVAAVGTSSAPADSVYGIGFQLSYPKEMVDSAGVVVRYDSSWLGTESVDMITLDMDLYDNSVIEVGISRTTHTDTSGYGEICRIGIAMQDDISAKVEDLISRFATFSFGGAVMTSADERLTFLPGETDSVLIWQIGSLPVTWQDFYGTALPSGIQLDWTTTLEINSDHFQIERAAPGESFQSIGSTPATGNATERQQYQFLDLTPLQGENIYRLVEKDRDGAETYSAAISVFFGESNEVSLTALPTFRDDHLVFTAFSTKTQAAQFQLFDLQGHQLINQSLQMDTGTQTFQHACEKLSAGVYLFQLKTASEQITYKVLRY